MAKVETEKTPRGTTAVRLSIGSFTLETIFYYEGGFALSAYLLGADGFAINGAYGVVYGERKAA